MLYLIMTKVAMKKIKNRLDGNELRIGKPGKKSFEDVLKIVRKVQKKIEKNPRKYLSRSELREYGCIL